MEGVRKKGQMHHTEQEGVEDSHVEGSVKSP